MRPQTIGTPRRSSDPAAVGNFDTFTDQLPNDSWIPLIGQTLTTLDHGELAAALGVVGPSFTLPDRRGEKLGSRDVVWAVKARTYPSYEGPPINVATQAYPDSAPTYERARNLGLIPADGVLADVREDTAGGDVDVLRFELAVDSDVVVTMAGGAESTSLTLLNAARLPLVSTASDTRVRQVSAAGLVAGAHFLRVATPFGGSVVYELDISTVAGGSTTTVRPGPEVPGKPAAPTPEVICNSFAAVTTALNAGRKNIGLSGIILDQSLVVARSGTQAAPIRIFGHPAGGASERGGPDRAAKPGAESGATVQGVSSVQINGDHVYLEDVTFAEVASNGLANAQAVSVAGTGSGVRDCRFYTCGRADYGVAKGVVTLEASSRLAFAVRNFISGSGCLPIVQRVEPDRTPDATPAGSAPHANFPWRNRIVANQIQDTTAPEDDTPGAAIQIGQGNTYAGTRGSQVDLFDVEGVATEIECAANFVRGVQRFRHAVEIRASGVRLLYNEVYDAHGEVLVRGRNNVVDGNVLESTFGIVLENGPHDAVNNVVSDTVRHPLNGTLHAGIALARGGRSADETVRNTAAHDCRVLYNTVVQDEPGVLHDGCVGAVDAGGDGRTAPAANTVADNILIARGGEILSDLRLLAGTVWKNNLVFAPDATAGVLGPGDRAEDPDLDWSSGLPVPPAGSPARGGADPSFGVTTDVTGALSTDDWVGAYRAGAGPGTNAPPVWVTPAGRVGTAVQNRPLSPTVTLRATDAEDLVTLRVARGALPTGVTMVGGVISGTPTEAGTFAFTAGASDGVNAEVERVFEIQVEPPATNLPPTWQSPAAGRLADGTVGVAYPQVTLLATDPTEVVSYVLRAGTLPPGLTLTANRIAGTPSTAAYDKTYAFTIGATDGINPPVERAFSIYVADNLAADAATNVARWSVLSGQASISAQAGNVVLNATGSASSYVALVFPTVVPVAAGNTVEVEIRFVPLDPNGRPTFGLRQTDGNYEEALMVAPSTATGQEGVLRASYVWKRAHTGFHLFRRKDWPQESSRILLKSVIVKKK